MQPKVVRMQQAEIVIGSGEFHEQLCDAYDPELALATEQKRIDCSSCIPGQRNDTMDPNRLYELQPHFFFCGGSTNER
jgi:hypothetical protein